MQLKKTRKKKRRMRHPDSILQINDGTCYLCEKLNLNQHKYHSCLETHHIYGGPNRALSEQHGFKVKLCLEHHRIGPDAVHQNIKNMRLLQKDAQREYEKTHTRQQFRELIGRNYLDDE